MRWPALTTKLIARVVLAVGCALLLSAFVLLQRYGATLPTQATAGRTWELTDHARVFYLTSDEHFLLNSLWWAGSGISAIGAVLGWWAETRKPSGK